MTVWGLQPCRRVAFLSSGGTILTSLPSSRQTHDNFRLSVRSIAGHTHPSQRCGTGCRLRCCLEARIGPCLAALPTPYVHVVKTLAVKLPCQKDSTATESRQECIFIGCTLRILRGSPDCLRNRLQTRLTPCRKQIVPRGEALGGGGGADCDAWRVAPMVGLTLCHCSAHSDRSAWTRLCSDSYDTLSSLSQACRDLGTTSSPPLRQFCGRPVRHIHQCALSNLLCPNTTHRGRAHGERPSCVAVPEVNLRPFSRK